MSIKAINWAFEQKLPSSTSKLVLVKLADNANDDGECWPAQKTIARHTGLTRETVNRHIQKLEHERMLRVEHRDLGRGVISNVYYLNLDPVTLNTGGVTDDHRGCDRRSRGGVTDDHTNLKEESSLESKPYSPLSHIVQDTLEQIWQAYPSTRRCARMPALKSIQNALKRSKLSPVSLLDLTRSYAKYVQGDDPKYIPMLTTWMNQDRFEIPLLPKPDDDGRVYRDVTGLELGE